MTRRAAHGWQRQTAQGLASALEEPPGLASISGPDKDWIGMQSNKGV